MSNEADKDKREETGRDKSEGKREGERYYPNVRVRENRNGKRRRKNE